MTTIGQVVWHKRERSHDEDNTLERKENPSTVREIEEKSDNEIHKMMFQEIADGLETMCLTAAHLFEGEMKGRSPKPMEDIFLRLYAYGVRAVVPQDASENDPYDAVQFLINSRVNGELGSGNVPGVCEIVFNMAFTRAKIDSVEDLDPFNMKMIHQWVEFPSFTHLTVEELALIAKMHEQSVRNELHKGAPDVEVESVEEYGSRIAVTVGSAAKWLKSKEKFRPTRKPSMNKDQVQTPVASDGTYFGPDCRMGKGYKVGKKGEERYFENIRNALLELQSMPIPRWRRPNASGNFGIVSGHGWKAMDVRSWLDEV